MGVPNLGDRVLVDDPLGYAGEGIVHGVQTQPHLATLVEMLTITDRTDQSKVGQKVWVLNGHIEVQPS